MKTFTTLTLLALAVCSSAQSPYRPFPESNAGWVEEHSWLNGSYDWTTCVRTVRSADDTLIDGIHYHQLRSTGDCSWFNIFQSSLHGDFIEPDAVFAMFRQDVGARKVFAYSIDLQQDMLWYDFTLDVGDYPPTIDDPYNDLGVLVVALDSMELNDGYHRTWVLATQVEQDSAYCTIIEGVGSTYGLNSGYGSAPPFEWSDALTCHSANGTGIFPAGGPACYLSMAVADSKPAKEQHRAYPNPASSSVSITGSWPAGTRYVLEDALGAECRSGSLRTPSIELTGLSNGVYTIRVQDAAGNDLGNLRLVKE